jgi:hypothetical protein
MSSLMKRCSLVVAMMSAVIASGAARAQEQAQGCTLEKQVYTCNWQAFRSRLDAAHTVAVETQSMDRFTAAQLRKLAGELGKSVVRENGAADLTFLLIPVEPTGIHMGPRGEPLATLRIYAPGPATSRGTLLWAETYTGQPDRPWPVTVHALIEQFQEQVGRR